MTEQDLYAVLEVQRGASESDIRKSYRKLARQHHPDVNPNNPEAEERFKQISFAYDVLSDPEKRKRYDEFGMAGLAEGFDSAQARGYQRWARQAHRSPFQESFTSGGSLEDLLGDLFGMRGGRSGPARPDKGADIEGAVTVDFLDAIRGAEVRVQVHRPGGTGQSTSLRVKVPAGTADGSRIRLAGQGGPGATGGAAGDLFLTVHVRPHPFLTREGDDLCLDLPVTLPEAVGGAQIEIPTGDGRVTMKVPPRSQNDQRLRLRGKGVRRRDGGSGDLLVRLRVQLPEVDGEDAERLEALAREIEALYAGTDVRKDLKGSV